jgi:protein kinase A
MPTLGGLLKKKKTHSTGSKDFIQPSSPTVAEASSNIAGETPVSREDCHSVTEQSSHETHKSSTNASGGTSSETPMYSSSSQSAAYHSTPATSQTSHQYSQPIGGINSIINPSQSHNGEDGQHASGQQLLQQQTAKTQPRQTKGKYSLEDFSLLRTLGTGSFGRVHLVQSRHNHRFYAVKVLKKAQVVKMKQVEHTNDERRMLQRVKHPFLITLWGTFQDSKNLYMVMDFVEGGELFSLLRKSQVRLPVPRRVCGWRLTAS